MLEKWQALVVVTACAFSISVKLKSLCQSYRILPDDQEDASKYLLSGDDIGTREEKRKQVNLKHQRKERKDNDRRGGKRKKENFGSRRIDEQG